MMCEAEKEADHWFKQFVARDGEVETLEKQLKIAIIALTGYAECVYDSRSFDDGLLTFNARQALEQIEKMGK